MSPKDVEALVGEKANRGHCLRLRPRTQTGDIGFLLGLSDSWKWFHWALSMHLGTVAPFETCIAHRRRGFVLLDIARQGTKGILPLEHSQLEAVGSDVSLGLCVCWAEVESPASTKAYRPHCSF